MVKKLLRHHKVARRAASLSVQALVKMGRVVKHLHERGYDEKAAKLLLAASKRLVNEADRLEREAKKSRSSKKKRR